ncbi:HK97 gp10 family phage protein [Bacillus infantis]|uniref:HK97 gp10 family phage protein n=1 Tax=Bacillus infantis TaxID=324767 RepID=UPI002FBF1E74
MASVDNLANEIARQLRLYEQDVRQEVEVSKEEVSKELVSQLKQHPSPKLTGDYRKGWRAKRVGNKFIIHNKTDYQLTHLLENGHAKAGGGRVEAIPHIRPAEQEAITEFLRRVERAIDRG